jgi:hypothetical protein
MLTCIQGLVKGRIGSQTVNCGVAIKCVRISVRFASIFIHKINASIIAIRCFHHVGNDILSFISQHILFSRC